MARIPENITRLLTQEGFFEEFFIQCRAAKTNKEAYEKVEIIYLDWFGTRKFACFNSFKSAKNRFFSKKMSKAKA